MAQFFQVKVQFTVEDSKGKVYTPNTYLDESGSCPLGKWKEVEDEYIKSFKTSKTIL